MPKDYNITVTVRNNYLLTKMYEFGIPNAHQLHLASGVSATAIGRLLALKDTATCKAGWRRPVLELARFFNCLPSELFPPQHIDAPLRKNKTEFEVELADVSWLLDDAEQRALPPDERVYEQELSLAISDVLNDLSQREMDVLRMRFGLDGEGKRTRQEIGDGWNLSCERIAQIEHTAIRKLKHPSRRQKLVEFTEPL